MAVPKRKTSKGKKNQRRSHHALKKMNIAFDATTGEPKLSHHISLKDGRYNGKVMLKKASKTNTSADETDAAV